MKKKNITRKDFIRKTGKCAGGIICTPIILSVFQSCSKPDPISSIDENTLYISECPCHNAQFDQEGAVVQRPSTGDEIEPLLQYQVTDLNQNSFTIIDENTNQIVIPLDEHPSLKEVGGVSHIAEDSNDFDDKGLLFYRKNEDEIIALSRRCTHQDCPIDTFENI